MFATCSVLALGGSVERGEFTEATHRGGKYAAFTRDCLFFSFRQLPRASGGFQYLPTRWGDGGERRILVSARALTLTRGQVVSDTPGIPQIPRNS